MLDQLPHLAFQLVLDHTPPEDRIILSCTSHDFYTKLTEYWQSVLQNKFSIEVGRRYGKWAYHLETLVDKLHHEISKGTFSGRITPRISTKDDPLAMSWDFRPPVSLIKQAIDESEVEVLTYLMFKYWGWMKGPKSYSGDVRTLGDLMCRVWVRICYHLGRGNYRNLLSGIGTFNPIKCARQHVIGALEGASMGGHLTMVKEIIKPYKRERTFCRDNYALELASWKGYEEIVRYFFEVELAYYDVVIEWAARGKQVRLMWDHIAKYCDGFEYAIKGATKGYHFDLLRELMIHRLFIPYRDIEIIMEVMIGDGYIDLISVLFPDLAPHFGKSSHKARQLANNCVIGLVDLKLYRLLRQGIGKENIEMTFGVMLRKRVPEFFVVEVMSELEYAGKNDGYVDPYGYRRPKEEFDDAIITVLELGRHDLLGRLLKAIHHVPAWLCEEGVDLDKKTGDWLDKYDTSEFNPRIFKRAGSPYAYGPATDQVGGVVTDVLRRKDIISIRQLIERFGDRVKNWAFLGAVETNNEWLIRWCIDHEIKINLYLGKRIGYGKLWEGMRTFKGCYKEMRPELYPELVQGLDAMGKLKLFLDVIY